MVLAAMTKVATAATLLGAGQLDEAAAQVGTALAQTTRYPIVRQQALAVLALLAMFEGQLGDASDHAKEGLALFETGGGYPRVKHRLEKTLARAEAGAGG